MARVGAFALLAVVFQGCGGDDDDTTGSNGAKGGGAGTKSSGGTSGKGGSSGGKSGQGGAGGTSAGKGGKGGAGHGGTAGRGGGSPGGAGQGGAGDGGGGNDNVIPSNPECDCIALDPEDPHPEFSCTTTLSFAEDMAPQNGEVCDVQDMTVLPAQASCDNGGYLHTWQVGWENDYTLQRDAGGELVYFGAFGYLTECGTPAKYHVGTITAGERVGECNTDEPCAPCSSASNGEGGA